MRGFGQGRYRFTQQQLDRLRRLYETHGTATAVSSITGVCTTTLAKYRRLGWVCQRDPRILPPPTDLALRASAMTKDALMAHYGCSCALLYRWLRELGIKRKKQKARRVYSGLTMPTKDAIVLALQAGDTRAAAAQFGVCALTFRRWRKHYGLPIQPRKRRRANDNCVGWVEQYVQSDQYRRAA